MATVVGVPQSPSPEVPVAMDTPIKEEVSKLQTSYCKPMDICEASTVRRNGKTQYIDPSEDAVMELIEQMRVKLTEAQGEMFLDVGVGEAGQSGLAEEELALSLATLEKVADGCHADVLLLRKKGGDVGVVAECLVRRRVQEEDFMEVRVAVVGNVDAGKSTLLGVLTHGELDNGRGVARLKLFRHKHEVESGRTSSVGNDILGFDSKGKIVNKPDGRGSLDWERICREASKVVTFIDLAGHEKYFKTTIFGMTGHAPDFCMLMIGSNAGVVGMTKEHLGLALALSVPVFVVVTKIDMCPPNVLQENMKILIRLLKSPGCRKIPVVVSTEDDVITSALNFTSERVCPIFQVSNVTGENLGLLKTFLNLLICRMPPNVDKPAEFRIDETYSVSGVGTVVSGTCMQGVIHLGDTLLLGPTWNGDFQPVPIRSIHRKRLPVQEVRGGQTASFALKKYKRNAIHKGMVMVSQGLNPSACWEFEGDILILHHPTTISKKYQAMVHCGSTRQTASILHMNKEHLRTGDKASCLFKFIKSPEYISPGARMVFREGRTKAVGNVTKVYPVAPGTTTAKSKPFSKPSHHPRKPGEGIKTGGGRGRRRGGKKHTAREKIAVSSLPVPVPPAPLPATPSPPTAASQTLS